MFPVEYFIENMLWDFWSICLSVAEIFFFISKTFEYIQLAACSVFFRLP